MSSATSSQLRSSERAFHDSLSRLLCLLETRSGKSQSVCDPLGGLVQQTQLLASATRALLKKHEQLACLLQDAQCNDKQLNRWLSDAELLGHYSTLLSGSLKLVFGSSTSGYQFSPNSEFAALVVTVYNRLRQLSLPGTQQASQLMSILHSFECHFKAQWNATNCNTFKFDRVQDLFSYSHDIVSSPLLDIAKTVKRDYFELAAPGLGFKNLLVELFQLSSGELAVFKVVCGQLPLTVETTKDLLQTFSSGHGPKYKSFGRSLLFPTLRKGDLCIISEGATSVELSVKLGDDPTLSLSAIDAVPWEKHWKTYFRRLFSNPQFTPDESAPISMHMTKSAHPFQNFKLKHDKLASLRPKENPGLAVKLSCNEQAMDSGKQEVTERQNKTLLHKSRPLNLSASKLPSLDSFADLEKLDFETLLKIDESISMNSTPTFQPNPTFDECEFKRVDSSSSVSKAEVALGEYAEDAESVVSSHESKENTIETFDLSSEFHRPQLSKRKSSSLLSLFSSNRSKTSLRNHKNLALDLPSGDSTTSLFTLPTPTSPNSMQLPSPQRDDFCILPDRIDLSDGFCICEHSAQLSYWYVNSWRAVSKKQLTLKLQESSSGEVLCLIYDQEDSQKYRLCSYVSPEWKVTRSAAQDIQLRIPQQDIIASVLPSGASVISLRCPQVDKVLNTLHHCIRQNLPSKLKASSTYGTLSTTSSTFSTMDKSFSRSDTTSTGLSSIAQNSSSLEKEQTVSLLLLSNIKVRLHEKSKEHGWVLKSKGLLDVHSQEFRGQVSAIKFDLICDQLSRIEFTSKLDNIKRIGRTGVSLIHERDNFLIEFKNQIVANEVFKLITCLI
ncbi:LAQU0S18e02542g1_1 [Lachancea quebecensis]|uniref:LAQU0S18e02542g1_1 n=1 Tax=Lachancea quebecensis TaxID=1654605 RepID=A0A0P1L325_9SACH|nr:LAQU0S18e02542g1_1 [Lachancea quebecensis]